MSNAFAIKALNPEDNPHILGMGSARTGASDLLLDIWNGSTSGARVFAVQKDGRLWLQDGAAATPALTFTGDLDTGLYRIGANNLGVAVGGTKVIDVGAATIALTGAVTVSGALTIGGALAGVTTLAMGGALTGVTDLTLSGSLNGLTGLAVGGALTTVTNLAMTGQITGVTNVTASGVVTGTWQGSAIGTAYGGLALSSYTAGDLLYASSSSVIAKLGIGASNTVLVSNGSVPSWSASPTFSGNLTVGGNTTINGDLTVVGTATLTIGAVAASAITAGTFGSGAYVFPGQLDVTGELVLTDDVVLPLGKAIRSASGEASSALFAVTKVTTSGGTGAADRPNNSGSAVAVFGIIVGIGSAVSGLFRINTSQTVGVTAIGAGTFYTSGTPTTSQVGLTASATQLTLTNGASVADSTYLIYWFGAQA